MIFRSDEAKGDVLRSWHRPDRPFFASGACHVLAAAFLELNKDKGWHALHLRPEFGFRGSHIVASNGATIFDYHGFTNEQVFLDHYFSKIRRFFPQWHGSVERPAESPIHPAFCARHGLRRPDQFPHDPFPRALAFVQRGQAQPVRRQ